MKKTGKKNETKKRKATLPPLPMTFFHCTSIGSSPTWPGVAVEVSLDAEGIAGEGLMECIGVNIGKVRNAPQPPRLLGFLVGGGFVGAVSILLCVYSTGLSFRVVGECVKRGRGDWGEQHTDGNLNVVSGEGMLMMMAQ